MEYFDFDHAAHVNAEADFDDDDVSSTCPETNQEEATELYDSLFFDKSHHLTADQPVFDEPRTQLDTRDVECLLNPFDVDGTYPMFPVKEPCDLCRRMGLDCFISQRGILMTGCTCCISLYKECSLTRGKQPDGYSTFPGIAEDSAVDHGEPNCISGRAMRSHDYTAARLRKNGARFCRDAVKVLKNWLAEHHEHPYPNDREKDELKQLTGLKRSQISNWLANARRRGKVRPASGPASPILGAIDIPQRRNEFQALTPLDRWKASPPEHEAASTTAIARAVAAAPIPGRNSSSSSLQGSKQNSRKSSSNDDSRSSMFIAPSVSSLETGRSSTSDVSFASKNSYRSRGSLHSSLGDKDRRRRRRAPVVQRMSAQAAKSRSARIFQCTFCADTFSAKYDWQRHEKTLHLALERWTCCPNGGIFDVNGTPRCVFCQHEYPDADHLEIHKFAECRERTLSERTHYRKDHLRQHLKLSHGAKFHPSMESWKSVTNEIRSVCGFCPQIFATWQQRADHLAAHFRNGCDMKDWSGMWGFEPHVERLVENAIPPYLIAAERNTMDPFFARSNQCTPNSGNDSSLTRGTSAFGSDSYGIERDSNCWRRLEQGVSAFIVQQKELGVIPSDKQMQDKARLIVYDDDDPWNQTAADNQQWLETLKLQHGISDASAIAAQAPKLEEVPMMPPYAIPGGLKTGRPAATGTNPLHTPHMFGAPFSDVVGVIGPKVPAPPEPATMDFDFDRLDFSNLDLGMMDDLEATGSLPVTSGFEMGGRTIMTGSAPGYAAFEGQQNEMREGDLMSEQDLGQLAGYMAGLR